MADMLIGIIIAAIIGIGFFIFRLFRKKGEPETTEKYVPTTQDHLALDYIRSGIVKLKNGGYRLLVELPSVNLQLMSWEEQETVFEQYRLILNSIDFPIQFLQQSRIVDISEYLSMVEGRIVGEKNPLISKQLEFYSEFLEQLVRERSILTKKFYLVIPFNEENKGSEKTAPKASKTKNKTESEKNDVLEEEKRFDKARKQLYSRGETTKKAFRRFGINPQILDDQELLELFYTAYNKDRSVIQSLRHTEISDYTSLRVKAKRRELRNEI